MSLSLSLSLSTPSVALSTLRGIKNKINIKVPTACFDLNWTWFMDSTVTCMANNRKYSIPYSSFLQMKLMRELIGQENWDLGRRSPGTKPLDKSSQVKYVTLTNLSMRILL